MRRRDSSHKEIESTENSHESQTEVTIPDLPATTSDFTGIFSIDRELLRRKTSHPKLQFRDFKIGSKVPRNVTMVYIEGVAPVESVTELENRIQKLMTDRFYGIEHLSHSLQTSAWSPFPEFLQEENCEAAVTALKEGKILVLSEGCPIVLVAPTGLFHFLRLPGMKGITPLFGNLVRGILLAAMMVAIFFPGFYVAIVRYQYELVPFEPLIELARSQHQSFLPIAVEVLVIEFMVEILRIGLIRNSGDNNTLIGIVSGILAIVALAGAAMIELISAYTLIVAGITVSATLSLSPPELGVAARILRFTVILMSAVFGILGMVISASLLFAYIINLEPLGQPYLYPLLPFNRRALWRMLREPGSIPGKK